MATQLPTVDRRQFLRTSILAACALGAPFLMQCGSRRDAAIFIKESLPYPQDALEPYISARTMQFHYGKHYAGYVKKANRLAAGRAYAGKTSREVIEMTAGDPATAAIFNNAAQAWNHAYFFKCLKPDGGEEPQGVLADMIQSTFGSFVDFKEVFLTAAGDHFGSGWAWLVLDAGKLAVVAGGNADTPYAHDLTPLFTIDLWEHAYYLDYQNRRLDYVRSVLDHLANWDFVSARLEKEIDTGE